MRPTFRGWPMNLSILYALAAAPFRRPYPARQKPRPGRLARAARRPALPRQRCRTRHRAPDPRSRLDPHRLDPLRMALAARRRAFGGILGPVALMFGLTRTSGATASLMLNLESVLTALIALARVQGKRRPSHRPRDDCDCAGWRGVVMAQGGADSHGGPGRSPWRWPACAGASITT